MTKQEAIKLLTNKKVFVKNKSSEIQEKLFSFGIYWYGNLAKVQFEDAPFLYIGMENDILRISHGSNVYTFYEHKFEEITPEDILNITIDEPKYRPFKGADECWNEMLKHQPLGWIVDATSHHLITSINHSYIWISHKIYYAFGEAIDTFTFADGTPFGLKEED